MVNIDLDVMKTPRLVENRSDFKRWSNGAWDKLIEVKEDGTEVWKIFRPNGPFHMTIERRSTDA
nr:hypothetical protein [uncultured archaeon]UVT38859.1 hypothetical protein [uncultured bacterium]